MYPSSSFILLYPHHCGQFACPERMPNGTCRLLFLCNPPLCASLKRMATFAGIPFYTQGMTPKCHRNSDLVVMMSFGLEDRITFRLLGRILVFDSEICTSDITHGHDIRN
ncbi:hypothetical protein NPIL_199621 [Nephila pilipes]|uniref:Uncharacterized protein n=1 Tax=Nephila pilipes TaxID=299642 RepID=A0A8X6NT55_NEPPI|nr:hypothetical protein NPIL_199621 [Nephila pilipes]